MVELFLEREFDTPMSRSDLLSPSAEGRDCFKLHRVEWRGSLLSLDGRKLVCNFRAADAESVRIALRTVGADIRRLWPGTVHHGPHSAESKAGAANVIVRRSFAQPVTLDEIQAREDAGAWCLELRHVEFVRTWFSADRRRMLCLYRAPDAESVREAQRQASMPMEDVWGFCAVRPQA